MSIQIKILLLDDQFSPAGDCVAIPKLRDGLVTYAPDAPQIPKKTEDGFQFTLPPSDAREEVVVDVFVNRPENKTPERALEDAQRLISLHDFNAVLVDDSWGDAKNTSGHQEIIGKVIKMLETKSERKVWIVSFSQHLAGSNKGPRDALIEAWLEAGVPTSWIPYVGKIGKQQHEALGLWFGIVVRTRPAACIPISIGTNPADPVYVNGHKRNKTAYAGQLWGYLMLCAHGNGNQKAGDLGRDIDEIYKTIGIAPPVGQISKMIHGFKSELLETRSLLPESRLLELSTLGDGGSNKEAAALLAGFLHVDIRPKS